MEHTNPPGVVREIRAEMGRQGFTIASLARATDNLNQKKLYARFGSPEKFTIAELFALADALHVDLADLFDRARQDVAA